MNKILRFSLLSLLTIFSYGIGFADEAIFDFDTNYATLFPSLKGVSSSSSTDGDFTQDATTCTVNGVSFTVSKSTTNTANRIWSTSPRLRAYGGTITITAPTGKNITAISFTLSSSNPKWSVTSEVGTLTKGEWTGNSNSVILNITSNTQISKATVTFSDASSTTISAPTITGSTPFVGSTDVTITGAAGSTIYYTLDGTDPTATSTLTGASPLTFTLSKSATVKAIAVSGTLTSTVSSKDFTITTYTNATIADLNTYTADKQFINLTLTNAKVVYVDGYLVYVREGSKAAMFYNTGLTLALNSIISGNVKLDFTLYNSMPEVKKNSDTNSDGLTITPATSTDLDPVSATISELLSHNHFADLIKLTNVTITKEDVTTGDKTTTTYYANSGSDKITLYGNIALYSSLAGDGKTHNIIAGYNGIFGGIEEIKPYDVDGVTMGLNTITTDKDNANSPIYNLAGQRVNKSYKGVIIQNGKKMINK